MKLSLAEYDDQIGLHLHGIEAGSDMVRSHIRQMVYRPDFETLALDDLARTESILEQALIRVREAKAEFERKQPIA